MRRLLAQSVPGSSWIVGLLIASSGVLLACVGYYYPHKGFWNVRFIEVVSTCGTLLVGVYVSSYLARVMMSRDVRRSLAHAELDALDLQLAQLDEAWMRHVEVFDTATSAGVMAGIRRSGMAITRVKKCGVDVARTLELFIQAKRIMTLNNYGPGLQVPATQATAARTGIDNLRLEILAQKLGHCGEYAPGGS